MHDSIRSEAHNIWPGRRLNGFCHRLLVGQGQTKVQTKKVRQRTIPGESSPWKSIWEDRTLTSHFTHIPLSMRHIFWGDVALLLRRA